MKTLNIPPVQTSQNGILINPETNQPIDQDNWNYPADVNASFGIAYDKDHLYLRYHVNELHPKAVTTDINGPVWEDSCAEFFITFDGERYYNIEINCIGTPLVGYGSVNENRKRLNPELIQPIKIKASLGNRPVDLVDTPTEWTLDVVIPRSLFADAPEKFEKGQEFACNFYKCGDKQKQMHFLSWNPIDNPTPNFHLPEHFGRIILS